MHGTKIMASKKKKLITLGLRVLVTFSVLGALAYFLPVKMLLDSIKAITWKEWLFVISFFIAGHLLSALKWRKVLHASGVPVKVKDAILAHAAGLFANLCLPSIVGGDVLRAGIVVKKSGQLEAVTLGSITDRIIDTVALITIVAIASLYLPASAGETMHRVFIVIAFILLTSAITGIAVLRWFPVKFLPARLANIFKRLKIAVKTLLSNPGTTLISFILSIGIQGGFVLLNIRLANAIGINAGLWVWMWAWPLAKLIALAPISLGGLGVREFALAGLLAPFGVDATDAVAQSLSWEAVLILTGMISGIVIALFSGKSFSIFNPRKAPQH